MEWINLKTRKFWNPNLFLGSTDWATEDPFQIGFCSMPYLFVELGRDSLAVSFFFFFKKKIKVKFISSWRVWELILDALLGEKIVNKISNFLFK